MEDLLIMDTLLPAEIIIDNSNNKRTAKTATHLIQKSLENCYEPSAQERSLICVEFARLGKPVYGKAFDLYQFGHKAERSSESISRAISRGEIRLLEVKSTGRGSVDEDSKGYFFSLSTAELLVAQALGESYQFVFFNTSSKKMQIMTLPDIYKKARGVYPTWSIRF